MRTITRIDVGSAFRVGAIAYAIFFTIFGLLSLAMQVLFFAPFMNSITTNATVNSNPIDLSLFAGVSLISLLCFYFVGIAMAAIFGGISTALLAWAYNLAARWVGGLKIRLDTDSSDLIDELGRDIDMKRKRGEL
ncbi:MAG: DUF3566 domain-containing protein [Anaerolineae bacterium]|nr:DUF3566 domain-containing protein [Anaerolineae bacterium]